MKYSIADFKRDFPTDDVCLEFLWKNRFGHLKGYYRVRGRKVWSHQSTRHQISPTAGTIFDHSSTPLTLWFYAMFLFATSKNGVSAKELQRQLGVTYKCAYRIGKQIRALMFENEPLKGIVEADDAFFQGRKGVVVAAVERGGRAKAKAVPRKNALYTRDFLKLHVAKDSTLITDAALQYTRLKHVKHISKNMSKEKYVKGPIHTNTVEGYWNQVKRSINGTYHWVSPQYLQSYLDYFSFHHSYRYSSVPLFSLLLSKAARSV